MTDALGKVRSLLLATPVTRIFSLLHVVIQGQSSLELLRIRCSLNCTLRLIGVKVCRCTCRSRPKLRACWSSSRNC